MIDIAAERRAMFEHDKYMRRVAREYSATPAGLTRVEADMQFWTERVQYGRLNGMDTAITGDWAHEANLCDAIRNDILAEMADTERRVA